MLFKVNIGTKTQCLSKEIGVGVVIPCKRRSQLHETGCFHMNPSHDNVSCNYMSHVMGKPDFSLCEKGADQLCSNCTADQVTAQLISAFVFATRIVPFLFFLNPKFQASSHHLQLHRPVCVRPGWKPEDRFSHIPAHILYQFAARNV